MKMKTKYFAAAICIALGLYSCHEAKSPIALQKEILAESGKLEQSIATLRDSVAVSHSPKNISRQFQSARLQYKKVEWALEYFLPQILTPDEKASENPQDTYFRPRNFTYLDSIVQSGKVSENKKLVLEEIDNLLDNSHSITSYLETIDLENEGVAAIE